MNKFVKNIPNFITAIRIAGAVVLLFLEPLSLPFFLVYGFCGLTDALDGFLARKLHAESIFGSILDSVSDLFFYAAMGAKILPVMMRVLELQHWLIILITTGFHVLAYIICFIKFKKFSSIHTYLNKVQSALIYLFPFFLIGEVYLLYSIYIYVGGFFCFMSSIDINLIHLFAKDYSEKNKSFIHLLRYQKEEKNHQ